MTGWLLLISAHSALLANGAAYFSKWIVFDLKAPAILFNALLSIVALLIIAAGPPLSRLVDSTNLSGRAIALSTAATGSAAFALSLLSFKTTPHSAYLVAAATLFALSLLGYNFSMIYLNSCLLTRFSTHQTGYLSGLGSLASWLGAIVGLLTTYGFVVGIYIPNFSGDHAAFLPSSTLFVIVATTGLLLLGRIPTSSSEQSKSPRQMAQTRLQFGYFPSSKNAASPLRNRRLLIFLAGCLLILDTIYTLEATLPLHLTFTQDVAENAQTPILLIILLGAALGGATAASLRKNSAAPFASLVVVACTSLAFCSAALGGLKLNFTSLYAICFLGGIAVGAIEALLREGFSKISNSTHASEYFTYYAITNRVSAALGPAIIASALAITATPSSGYRVGYMCLAALTIIGLIATVASGALKRSTAIIRDGKY